jgi:ATP-dependent RNA helicase DeaD
LPEKQPTQVLVLAPTRELAIQVAEAFHRYATHMPGFHVLPIYGGQAYGTAAARPQARAQMWWSARPGRVIDHMQQGHAQDRYPAGTWCSMRPMKCCAWAFIDDVEWVLSETPETCQMALFSATMPRAHPAHRPAHLEQAEEITIQAEGRRPPDPPALLAGQRLHKLDALTRILEVEPFEGMIVFARTKRATDGAGRDACNARGFSPQH